MSIALFLLFFGFAAIIVVGGLAVWIYDTIEARWAAPRPSAAVGERRRGATFGARGPDLRRRVAHPLVRRLSRIVQRVLVPVALQRPLADSFEHHRLRRRVVEAPP